MNLELMRNFNLSEREALIKLIIKVAASDNNYTQKEKATIKEVGKLNGFVISNDWAKDVTAEDYDDIVSAFISKSNLNRAYSIVKDFAQQNRINPAYEGKCLGEIKQSIEKKKKSMKFSLSNAIKYFFLEFKVLWGGEDINPRAKNVLAIIFTIIACVFGSFWTSVGFLGFGGKTQALMPQASAVLSSLLILGTLTFRNYLPRPKSLRNIIFCFANFYLFSILSMHILGRGAIEKGVTVFIFFGLIILLWLSMKEILGFIFLGFFALLIYKIIIIDIHISWRAFPFIASAFIGISFQSENFFNEVTNISNSFFKRPHIEKKLAKESVQLAGKRIGQIAKTAISTGASAAAGLPPGTVNVVKPNVS